MPDLNYLAILVAAVVAFVIGGLWYSPLLFGNAYARLRGIDPAAAAGAKPPVATLLAEFGRCLITAFVLARFVVALDVVDGMGALQLGIWIGVGLQAVLLVGSVIHESVPWKLYLIHAGDAVVKSLAVTAILGAWR